MGRPVLVEGEIQLDDDHRYWVFGPSGILEGPYPSVTTCLQTKRPWYTQAHAARGNRIHALTQCYDETGIDDSEYGSDEAMYMAAYRSFLEAAKGRLDIWGIERRFIADSPSGRYGGTVDRLGFWEFGDPVGPKPIVLDIKTGYEEEWHGVQLAAYALPHEAEAGACLYINKKGGYRITFYDHDQLNRLYAEFDARRAAWQAW